MGKFCTACGSGIEEGEAYCSECGTPVKQKQDLTPPVISKIEQPETSSVVPVEKKTSSALIGIAVVAVIICVIIGIFISAVSNNGDTRKDKATTYAYEAPIKTYFKALEKGDWDKYSSIFTHGLINTIERNYDYSNFDDGNAYMQNKLKSISKKFGNNFKISYEITDTEKIGEGAFNNIERDYILNNNEEIDINEAYKMNVLFNVKGDKNDLSYTQTFTVAKIKSKWYIIKGYSFSDIPYDLSLNYT